MQCPTCQGGIGDQLYGDGRCPHCAVKFYIVDKWRWLRGIACQLPAVLLNHRWYPTKCNIVQLLCWYAVVGTVFFLLLIISVRLVAPQVDRVPQDGSLRLDL
jgi:hypothetical protein